MGKKILALGMLFLAVGSFFVTQKAEGSALLSPVGVRRTSLLVLLNMARPQGISADLNQRPTIGSNDLDLVIVILANEGLANKIVSLVSEIEERLVTDLDLANFLEELSDYHQGRTSRHSSLKKIVEAITQLQYDPKTEEIIWPKGPAGKQSFGNFVTTLKRELYGSGYYDLNQSGIVQRLIPYSPIVMTIRRTVMLILINLGKAQGKTVTYSEEPTEKPLS